MFDSPPIENLVLDDLSDLLFLAWRKEFFYSELENTYTHKRDYLLLEIAKTEEELRRVVNFNDESFKFCPQNNIDFEQLLESQSKLINLLYGSYYGGDECAKSYSDLDHSLSKVGVGLGWETALKELHARFPDRLDSKVEIRGRHWIRASYFGLAKEYCEVFRRWVRKSLLDGGTTKPFPLLGFENIIFQSNKVRWFALNLKLPSDEEIFQTFMDVFEDNNHRHNTLFKAVNKAAFPVKADISQSIQFGL